MGLFLSSMAVEAFEPPGDHLRGLPVGRGGDDWEVDLDPPSLKGTKDEKER